MSYDIYGNPLMRGHCEVHPHVHEEYPCSVCIQESNNRNAQQKSESEHYEMMRLEHELELSHQRIAELEAQLPKWISVDDRLPEYPDEVLCITSSEVYHIGKFCQLSRLWTKGVNYERMHTVTHWMPPKEKDHE